MIDRASLRMSAALLLAGQMLYIVITQFHAGGDANDHRAIFAVYAGSGIWMECSAGSRCGCWLLPRVSPRKAGSLTTRQSLVRSPCVALSPWR